MKFIKVETLNTDSQVKIVSLNRPEVKNAFHPDMIQEITEAFKNFHSDPSLKVVVLKGEGSAFCAGADLKWMKEMVNYSFEENIHDSEKIWNMFESIALCEVPVIGILHGAVYGGAIGLAACCDYVIAKEKTQFCFSEVKLGLSPAVISSFILRKVTDGYIRPLMVSAEVFTAKMAQQMGLIHEIKNSSIEEVIRPFLLNGLSAMRETKKLLNSISMGITWTEQKQLSTKVISKLRMSPEGQARLRGFVEKK